MSYHESKNQLLLSEKLLSKELKKKKHTKKNQKKNHLPFLTSPASFSVFTGIPIFYHRTFVFKMFFIMPNPLNITDGFPICLENSLRDYVFAHYSDFILHPDTTVFEKSISTSQPHFCPERRHVFICSQI